MIQLGHFFLHGFGQRYDLPLPLSLYLVGTAAAIVFSFVVVGLFVRRAPPSEAYPHLDLLPRPLGRAIASGVGWLLKLVALCLTLVTVLAGFIGNADPYRNIAPTMVWIIGWVGLAYVSAFGGNVWAVINPWRTLFGAVTGIGRRVRRQRVSAPRFAYPRAFGVWPAFVLLLAFSWTELVYPSPAVPLHIAWLLVGYSALTWSGMAIFGCEAWLAHGELFSVLFGLLSRFAPTEVRVVDPAICARCGARFGEAGKACVDCGEFVPRAGPSHWTLALRPFGAGLLDARPVSASLAAFILLVLSTVLYDGVLGTPEWSAVESTLAGSTAVLGDVAPLLIRSVGLVAFWALFAGAYLAVCRLMSTLVARHRLTWDIARNLALTLVPIAIAYHLAHYLAYLLVQGQYIVPLLSDPFGFGWNLFGSAGYRVDVGIVGARFEWYAAVVAIVIGHIAAVYLAHARSMQLFPRRREALRSQLPLTALMVAYTFVSLSILAEPITERRPSAQPVTAAGVAVPADAVLPEAGSGRLGAVGAGRSAGAKLTYRLLGSAFHDGTPMTPADILYAYMFAYRWSERSSADATTYDPAIEQATAAMRRRLVAIKFVGTDTTSKSFRVDDVNVVRSLFIVDVYLNGKPHDPEQEAAIAPPWSTIPWELLVLMEEAVVRGWAAFSDVEAKRRGIEWLDLARSEDLKRRLASLVADFARDGYRPDSLRHLVSADDARKRWAALAAFYKAHNHFLVTNGPYQLKAWSADNATLDVFRDLSYPLGVGSFDGYAIPRRGFITKVVNENGRVRIQADIETIEKFGRKYDIVRAPLASVAPSDRQRAAPECRYMVLDEAGDTVLAGAAMPEDDATFTLDLAGKLPAGRYSALAEIVVNGNAANADIRRFPVRIGP